MNISIKTDLFLQLQPNPVAPPPPAPPWLPTYECPICTEPLVEQATATSCGHLFCEDCITAAIHLQTKCPICRRKVTSRCWCTCVCTLSVFGLDVKRCLC
ncbi:putative Zinc finger, RING-type [Helianthus annuus]|nr:putative Zinc finger, RING-type [Helianthus annuus]